MIGVKKNPGIAIQRGRNVEVRYNNKSANQSKQVKVFPKQWDTIVNGEVKMVITPG